MTEPWLDQALIESAYKCVPDLSRFLSSVFSPGLYPLCYLLVYILPVLSWFVSSLFLNPPGANVLVSSLYLLQYRYNHKIYLFLRIKIWGKMLLQTHTSKILWNCIIFVVVVFMDLIFGTWVPNVFQNCIQHELLLLEIFFMCLEIRIGIWLKVFHNVYM